jgi:hypothetical protein
MFQDHGRMTARFAHDLNMQAVIANVDQLSRWREVPVVSHLSPTLVEQAGDDEHDYERKHAKHYTAHPSDDSSARP